MVLNLAVQILVKILAVRWEVEVFLKYAEDLLGAITTRC